MLVPIFFEVAFHPSSFCLKKTPFQILAKDQFSDSTSGQGGMYQFLQEPGNLRSRSLSDGLRMTTPAKHAPQPKAAVM